MSHAPNPAAFAPLSSVSASPPRDVLEESRSPAQSCKSPCDNPSVWSAKRIELLTLHHGLGLSAAISAQLIGDVTRNAVISKRRRLGLIGACARRMGRLKSQPIDRVTPAAAPPRTLFWPTRPTNDPVVRVARAPLPPMDTPPPVDARPKRLADKNPGECAWPLGPSEQPGDYRTLFCCAPVVGARVYCAFHGARAYAGLAMDALAPAPRQTIR